MDLCATPAVELARLIQARQLSAAELLAAVLARIDEANPAINAIVTLAADQASAVAAGLDARAARGSFAGPLHGLPIAVKDLAETGESGRRSARRCSPPSSPASTRRTWPGSSRPARW